MSQPQNQSATMTLWIMWGAMLFALIMFGVVLFVLTQNKDGFTPPEPDLIQTLTITFSGLSVAELGAIYFLRKLTFFSKLKYHAFESLDELRDGYKTASILSWAFCEAIAIYGFVLGVMTYDPTYYLYFAPPAVLLFLLLRPQLGRYEKDFKWGATRRTSR
ncbi:hypothetical protein FIV42_01210 [Persicimonas caeni]|uniref:Uncharacterized protein n=1 Tax=Persicimonas caeni TaxID=2292766 RepID=A0A4Y6PMA8_PERCE|nr:hypothetical protein [Persicimonas caeni]QDG49402.1 hypothetical protein FIV42_01210 [Persicimonas caeni]QED30623.1 hypothetical protein FRD00_01205 [Persicimonas caeni]